MYLRVDVCLSSEEDLLFSPCRHCCACSVCGLMYNNCISCRTLVNLSDEHINIVNVRKSGVGKESGGGCA